MYKVSMRSQWYSTSGCTYAKVLEEVLGLAVDVELAALGVLGEVESGNLGNVLILALTLLLLKLEGDTADGTTLNTLHEMGGVTSNLQYFPMSVFCNPSCSSGCAANLVAQALGGDDGDLIADALVGLEVEGELGVVPLNDDLGGLLDSLGADATHFGGTELVIGGVMGCEGVARGNAPKSTNLVLSGGVHKRLGHGIFAHMISHVTKISTQPQCFYQPTSQCKWTMRMNQRAIGLSELGGQAKPEGDFNQGIPKLLFCFQFYLYSLVQGSSSTEDGCYRYTIAPSLIMST